LALNSQGNPFYFKNLKPIAFQEKETLSAITSSFYSVLGINNGLITLASNVSENPTKKRLKIGKKSITFVSVTGTLDDYLWAVDKEGSVFQCAHDGNCLEDWVEVKGPEQTLQESSSSYLKPKKEGKLVFLQGHSHTLLGLDETGKLWKNSNDIWNVIPTEVNVAHFSISPNFDLYITSTSNNIYHTNLELDELAWIRWSRVTDQTDFSQAVIVGEKLFAVNYYKQLFVLNDIKEWEFVEEGFQKIFLGDFPSTRRRFSNHGEL